jgi:hypothetical protein
MVAPQAWIEGGDRRSDLEPHPVAIGDIRNELHLHAEWDEGDSLADGTECQRGGRYGKLTPRAEPSRLAVECHEVLLGQ